MAHYSCCSVGLPSSLSATCLTIPSKAKAGFIGCQYVALQTAWLLPHSPIPMLECFTAPSFIQVLLQAHHHNNAIICIHTYQWYWNPLLGTSQRVLPSYLGDIE